MTTNFDLNKKLQNVKCFVGSFPRDKIPRVKSLPAALIMNTDTSTQPGEHWVAVYINEDGIGEYFDSFGLKPLFREIVEYLDNNCKEWYYNNVTIQGLTSITCGQYCVLFVYLRSIGISLCQIINLFTTDYKINDEIIKSLYKEL